ncbi:NACHT domain-containing protein [Streptomyces sp. NPDC094032]|uniref:NACHT domain-containing protein n=1 Tax=Streptomyces sp. NPDC094032 TaxID=3155308 RepID=UPI003318959D
MSAEATAIRLGSTVATRAVQLWLAPKEREQRAGSSMSELIRVRIPGLRVQRSLTRQFEQIADAVAGRMQPLLEHEFRDLTTEGRAAVQQAVISTFAGADLSDEAILGSDADPVELARRIRRSAPVPVGFSDAETRFYDVLLDECCDCYVRVLRGLPVFTERAVGELLARATSFGDELEKVLERLPARSLYAPEGTGEDEAFRREYLSLVSRSMDEIELFGLGPSDRAPRTRLSVAYVSLRASEDDGERRPARARPVLRGGAGQWERHEAERASSMRVEAALKDSCKVLLRGEAGSGKTTLLQWLAVTAARGAFTGALADWNGLIPVVIKLRQYAGAPPPPPEAMLDRQFGQLAGVMPKSWMHRVFREGRALLLVDGVDELLASERRAVREWLRGLLGLYPDTRIVVTSRPAAARVDWLRDEKFTPFHLERMTPSDLTAFVRQWHAAVRGQGDDLPCPEEELSRYERLLLTSLQDRPHLQSLAMNPLLAALLCALHLARRGELPRNRMELYRMALEVLVQQRDADRGVVRSELPVALTLTDKLCLLRDLAWRLSDNGRSEIGTAQAAAHLTAKLAAMRHLEGLDGAAVLDHLLHRSGVLRSPVEGRVDFVHRTFQEYLAAHEAAGEDRIGNLVGRAHLDLWRETVIMAAGHANRTQQEELLGGILDRAKTELRHARPLRLVAASCQETMAAIPEAVAGRLDEAMVRLVPPRRSGEVASLAAVGSPLIRRLPPTLEGLSSATAAATVHTVARIGGDAAFARLERYASDDREDVHRAIIRAWEYFDADAYAEAVLRQLPLDDLAVHLTHPGQWAPLTRLRDVRWVTVDYRFEQALSRVTELPPLHGLWMSDIHGDADLSPLRSWSHLEALLLGSLPAGHDLTVLTSLTRLVHVTLQGNGRLRGLDDLTHLSASLVLLLFGYDLSKWNPRFAQESPLTPWVHARSCVLPEDVSGLPVKLRLLDCRTPDGRPHPLNK